VVRGVRTDRGAVATDMVINAAGIDIEQQHLYGQRRSCPATDRKVRPPSCGTALRRIVSAGSAAVAA
jgi:hypothetical protein